MAGESLDEIETTPPRQEPPPKKTGRGGARPGAGRKPNGTKAAPPAPSSGGEESDPDVKACLEELGGGEASDEAIGQLACLSLMAANPQAPIEEKPVKVMTVTGKAMAKRYLGKAESYLSLEGLFLIIWGSMLIRQWLYKAPNANPSNPDPGAERDGQNIVRAPAGLS